MNVGLLFSFSAGILSVFSPCVLPIIPIVVGHALISHKNGDILAFITGFYLILAFITIFTVIFTLAINHYILYFRVVAAVLIILLGIVLIFNKNLFNYSYTPKNKNKTLGSFLVGFLTSLAWAPCYGPYIVSVAAYSTATGNWIYSIINMMLFAAGFTVTLFIIAFLTSKINFEGISNYSYIIRIFSGVIIIIAGTYLLIGYL
jgi:cytochrome c-type biogenesis protein